MAEQKQWRFCQKCFALIHEGFGAGYCPAGGGHDPHGSDMYLVTTDVPKNDTLQDQWRFCRKCCALFYGGFDGTGFCPAGGGHDPHGSYMYLVTYNAPANDKQQDKWRFCRNCYGLVFDGFGAGPCPAGGRHDPTGSAMYFVRHEPASAPEPTAQDQWRFCRACYAMFFDGFAGSGSCSAGSRHESAGSYLYVLARNILPGDHLQDQWRFCRKCCALFFDGFDGTGFCPTGQGHDPEGSDMYVLAHDLPPSQELQDHWRFCRNCCGFVFDGFGAGPCPAGGRHDTKDSFMYLAPHTFPVLPPPPPPPPPPPTVQGPLHFDTGPLTSHLPLGGSAHLVVDRKGNYTLTTHAHDSGFDNIRYLLGVVLFLSDGRGAFGIGVPGRVEGTEAGLPFGKPDRNHDQTIIGKDPLITEHFDSIVAGAHLVGRLDGEDVFVGGLQDAIGDAFKEGLKSFGSEAGKQLALKLLGGAQAPH